MLRRKLIDVEKFRLHLNAVNESMDLHQGGWQFVSQAVMIGGIASSQSSWVVEKGDPAIHAGQVGLVSNPWRRGSPQHWRRHWRRLQLDCSLVHP